MQNQVLNEAQKILIQYFTARGVSMAQGMAMLIYLWDERAEMEMLKYIIDTEEEDPQKLYSTALEISRKYKVEESLPEY